VLCHLPRPYEDELLSSIVARYCARTGAAGWAVATNLFGKNGRAVIDLPGSLDATSAATFPVWGMTAASIANRLTLFPFYARYLPPERAADCLIALRSPNSLGVPAKIGLTAASVKASSHLRFCLACRDRDLAQFGETWWRRAHQIPGVLICVEHGQRLIDSGALRMPRARWDFADATATTGEARGHQIQLVDPKIMSVARRSIEILNGEPTTWRASDLPGAYREAVLERGYGGRGARIAVEHLDADFSLFWKSTPLETIAGIGPDGVGAWLRASMRQGRHATHSTRHALLQVFIEAMPIRRRSLRGLGRTSWKCPNPYAAHAEEFPISRVLTHAEETGIVASARCDCGFEFTFRATRPEDPAMPIVSKRCRLGPTWTLEARRLHDLGMNTAKIAKTMKIQWHIANSLLAAANGVVYPRAKPSAEQIAEWRSAWIKLLELVPERSRHIARGLDPPLYKKLWRWDSRWLLATAPCRRPREARQRIDWADRDRQWSAALTAAARQIKAKTPLRRASVAEIIRTSNLPGTVLNRLEDLPKCKAALTSHKETVTAFHLRKQRDVDAPLDAITVG